MTPTPSTPPHMQGERKRRLKITTTTVESEVLRQGRLAEVANRELFEASGTRRPHLPSQICPTADYGAHTYIKKDVFVFLKYE